MFRVVTEGALESQHLSNINIAAFVRVITNDCYQRLHSISTNIMAQIGHI